MVMLKTERHGERQWQQMRGWLRAQNEGIEVIMDGRKNLNGPGAAECALKVKRLRCMNRRRVVVSIYVVRRRSWKSKEENDTMEWWGSKV